MKKQVEVPVLLKKIFLEYADGKVLIIEEKDDLVVGTEFMKVVNLKNIKWRIENKKKNLLKSFFDFFRI